MSGRDEKGRYAFGHTENGRPTTYTDEIGKEICVRLADGETLNAICKSEHLPSESVIRYWASNSDHPMSANYRKAREVGYLKMADELLEIADDGENDWMERTYGEDKPAGWLANGEHISRSKLRVDTRKWLLARALPKIYGDKVTTEHTGEGGGPIKTNIEVCFVTNTDKS